METYFGTRYVYLDETSLSLRFFTNTGGSFVLADFDQESVEELYDDLNEFWANGTPVPDHGFDLSAATYIVNWDVIVAVGIVT